VLVRIQSRAQRPWHDSVGAFYLAALRTCSHKQTNKKTNPAIAG
jgi:hypothetical protein